MLWEYRSLAAKKGVPLRGWTLYSFGLGLPVAAYVAGGLQGPALFLVAGVAVDLVGGLFEREGQSPFAASGAFALALTYLALPMATLALIRGYGWLAVLGAFALIWVNDIAAFLVGVTFGRHRLLPRVSPKKSVEGALGGLAATVIVSIAISGWYHLGYLAAAALGFVVCVTGVLGDLVESSLKRDANVKDSGKMLPGHGGFLDRFDSTLFVMPVIYLVLSALVR
jgi:phosphatidate cytidylyltransferase